MFSDKLKELRKSKGATQDDLALAINVSRQSVGNYENYSVYPDLDTLVLIADFFNVSTDYLLGRTEQKYNNNLLNDNSNKLLQKINLLDENTNEMILKLILLKETKGDLLLKIFEVLDPYTILKE